MIKSRKIVIESAVKEIFGEHIKLKLSSKPINNNLSNSQEKKSNDMKKTANKTTNPAADSSQKDNFNDSSKNLANFFNGEIIEIDE